MMRLYRSFLLSVTLLFLALVVNSQPVAIADDENMFEDTQTTFSVTDNDEPGPSSSPVDPSTVDLDPLGESGTQNSFTSPEGEWSVSPTGDVTFIPFLNFFGTASISYSVMDEALLSSPPASITVEVAPDNDAPVITGQVALSTPEDTPLTIELSNLTITDPDNPPADFSLSVADGTNYSRSGNTITPSPGYNGTLTVPVTVTDGDGGSDSENLAVTVTVVNSKPVIASQQTLTTPEETGLTLVVGNFTITDSDNTSHTLSVQDGTGYTRTGNTITPNLNFNGDLTVPVLVNDGTEDSDVFNATVSVTALNDIPQITAQVALSTPEETPLLIERGDVTIADPDDTDFTITVIGGLAGYTTSGNTITPNPNFNGNITVPVTVNDGVANSPSFDLIITVTGVNNAPVVAAQAPLSTAEETALTLLVGNFTITDPDNTTHTLTVQDGTNYTRVGNTITPVLNFNGALTVPITVSDGSSSSAVFDATVNVNPVNDPPAITGQVPLSTPEDTPLTIEVGNLTIADPDNTTFTLTVADGTNYTRSGNTITPAANFNGTLTVPVTVNDGTVSSPSFDLSVTVSNVNTVPTVSAQVPLSTPEETALTLLVGNFTINDADNTTHTLTVQDGTNYTRVGNTITPLLNFNGALTVPVTVSDGSASSPVFEATVNVTAVNDPPAITGQAPLSTPEGTALTIVVGNLTIADPDNTTFTLAVADGTNYTRSGNTITPDANFNGTLTVPVTINDGTVSSPSFNLSVTVSNVNTVPVISAQVPLSTAEEAALTLLVGNFTINDADNTAHSLAVLDGTNYSRVGNTITPSLNFNGSLTVPVVVNDGTANSEIYDAVVSVTPINDTPVITAQASLSTSEETSLTILATNLVIADPDNNSFTLSLQDGANYTRSGNTITPNTNFSGTLTVPATVSDGTVSSAVFDLSVTVSNVNNTPVITAQVPLSTPEETAFTLTVDNFTVTDPDNTTFTLSVQDGTNYTRSGNTITPGLNYNGVLTVPVTVNDGASTSGLFNANVSVTPVNDPPVITGQTPLSTAEDTPLAIIAGNLIIVDPDNTTFTLSVLDGANYTHDANTITPAPTFNGTLTVAVHVNDGTIDSQPYSLSVTVSSINNAPAITEQVPLTTPEETALTITVANLTISDPDNTTFTLAVQDGTNYSRDGNKITPAINFNGNLTVPVTVSDGSSTSAPFNLIVTVTPINDAPVITGNIPVITPENTPITLTVSDFTIQDPDNVTNDFKLKILQGGFTLSGTTITPPENFDGEISVTVIANDGGLESVPYNFKITVSNVNNPPVITGQSPDPIELLKNITLVLNSGILSVSDKDPEDFETGFPISISNGDHYTVSGTTIIPELDYVGPLSVIVTVSDGKNDSPPFTLKIIVNEIIEVPQINGQDGLVTNEDTPLALVLENFNVTDPQYPTGYTLTILDGPEYTVDGLTITPNLNKNGIIKVGIQVSNGRTDPSRVFLAQVFVSPINDAPQIIAMESAPILYEPGSGPISITEIFEVEDVDNEFLNFAEIRIIDSMYSAQNDELIFENSEASSPIRAIYDPVEGILSMIGYASKQQYIEAIRAVKYNYRLTRDENGEQSPISTTLKSVSINLSDGLAISDNRERSIELETSVDLDIPNAFTPNNGDLVNNTWAVHPVTNSDQFDKTIIRVYNKSGLLIYESVGLDKEWDGTFKGQDLPADTYYYTIDLRLSFINKTYKGIVTILR